MRRSLPAAFHATGLAAGGVFALALATVPTRAWAQATGIIDPEWRAVQQQMKGEQHARCDRAGGFMQRVNCKTQVEQEYEGRGDVPGTEQYVRKHYGWMTVDQLAQQIERLSQTTYGVARHVHNDDPGRPGEISYEMIERDVNGIDQLIRIKGGIPPAFRN